ncbi:MAG TPA: CaiB/BaiF CoA-transferase family protein [Dongiaceae bacterium]|nr:CaiB/BaiF CoA-transferase family protein [Dongiaceae bacterium]
MPHEGEAPAPPLAGVRVIDLSRLAPGPYCSMLLADLGADVIAVRGGRGSAPIPVLMRGKRLVTLDLREPLGRSALRRLVRDADVLLEGFRPGVASRLVAGYEELARENPRLIYCSLTGYGQTGPRSGEAGHDINYLAASGVLGAVGPPDAEPVPPLNLLADFGAGGMLAAFAITTALFERARTGRGRYVDVAMVDGCLSMMEFHRVAWGTRAMPRRGTGVLSGTAPAYRTYRCADGRFVAVGALERPMFETLWRTLGFDDAAPDMDDASIWPATARALQNAFASKDRDAWAALFAGVDACVSPVLAPDELDADAHVRERRRGVAGAPVVPRFGGAAVLPREATPVDETDAILRAARAPDDEIAAALAARAAVAGERAPWPAR